MRLIEELVGSFKDQELALPIWYENESLKVLDQTRLPFEEKIYTFTNVGQLGDAIRSMMIRGSGAIGICGAYGILLAALKSNGNTQAVREAAKLLKSTRPTAVNLMKTVDEMTSVAEGSGEELIVNVEKKAVEILKRQLEFEYDLGSHGANLIEDGDTIMTHCHSGAFGGAGYGGRALSVIRTAHEQGKNIHVYTCETRPYLQGARITALELKKFGIPHTLITDNMSGFCMREGKIDKVVVGSDRVAANGDLANKVGTYMHALAAQEHNIPFYTATSSHTIDFSTVSGESIEVEMRDAAEVTHFKGIPTAPEGTEALYPSFDITPHHLITGIITEKGVVSVPYETNLKKVIDQENVFQK
ncbi:S-methyl-5-thioribose-1-phosphate isomerase [Halobacillus naozhouensis]|uniref:Methylthioribose-1-phosphate isomerase n=1 Tax=Halobacillus naozhouensis TaxID=554880 RepID=A0ABY8IVN5_9BACI|nr:S-methyl-5-thioribose-1-phosphate isomerase [Halobacillus naozhouensis]WFT74267.1 S-methyl-5-thioribose-1-phosphate isomerase [Halobacillus naozhouensis]